MLDDQPTTRAAPRHLLAKSRLVLRVLAGPDKGKQASVEPGRSAAIGASPDNALVLRDPTVSRYHAEVASVQGGAHVKDLGSLNGTFVGAARIEAATVPPDTRLQLGSTLVVIEQAGAEPLDSLPPEEGLPGFVAKSRAMREVVALARKVASSDVAVLLQGETGTGKEMVARAIHELGPRRKEPFVVLDCGSLPSTLVSSELYGHERGAFTSADRRYAGAFERAHGGTLFLDEIGELPIDVQPTLLGVLERGRLRRLGGDQEIAVDVRVISATHRDLRAATNTGSFRADLYFRLAVARIVVPPLRERREDIEPLVRHFIEEATGDASALCLDAATMDTLQHHHFRGNVRELRNAVASLLALGHMSLEETSSSDASLDATETSAELLAPYGEARAQALARFERRYLQELIARCQGNASEAARKAKMDRSYLLSLLRRHGLR